MISHTILLTLTNWLRKSAFGVLVLCAISGTQDSPASFSWTATSSSQTLYFTDQSPPISRWTYSWTGSHVTGRVGEALVCSYHLRYDNCPISISRLFRMSHACHACLVSYDQEMACVGGVITTRTQAKQTIAAKTLTVGTCL